MLFGDILNFCISLLVICNPLASLPVLLVLTAGRGGEERKQTGVVAAIAVAVILIVVTWIGRPLLDFLAIRIPAFQMAGGIILFLLSLSMLNAQTSHFKSSTEDQAGAMHKDSIAIVPLAMPLMAGPGAISLVLVTVGTFPRFVDHIYMTFCVMIVAFLLGLILYFSGNIERLLGTTRINIINRLAGLIIAAMSVENFAKGAIGLFPGLDHLGK